MDVDLREQIAQVLSPDVARQLASTVGMDDGQGKDFIAAAVPALLAAFLHSFGSGGGKALSDAVANSDPNTLERLRRALETRDLAPLNEGANALAPVLGASLRDKLANGLATLIDTPIEAATPALGAVEQAAIAVLGQQDPSVWSDGDALRNFLTSQKGAFLSAVPAALAGLVGAGAASRPSQAPPAAAAPPPRPRAAAAAAAASGPAAAAGERAAAASAAGAGRRFPDLGHRSDRRYRCRHRRLLLLVEHTTRRPTADSMPPLRNTRWMSPGPRTDMQAGGGPRAGAGARRLRRPPGGQPRRGRSAASPAPPRSTCWWRRRARRSKRRA